MAKKKSKPKVKEVVEEFPAGNYDDSADRNRAIAEAKEKPKSK